MIGTWVSILPPLIAIVMVFATRRVLLSLGAGVVSGALIAAAFEPASTLKNLWYSVKTTFWDDGALNAGNVYIIIFILLLGIITAFVSLSGGSRAFADWAVQRIKTKRGAKLLTVSLGMAIFVDDYFNALAVGQISRPITDRHKISRAKLAYFIDSTSAPICVVSPISSWGAFLIGQLALIFGGAAAINYSPLSAFIMMAPMNFYVIATLSMVFFLAWTNFDLFEMKKHEQRATETGHVYDPDKSIPGQLKEDFPTHTYGKVRDLVAPIIMLIFVTFLMMFWTGYVVGGSMSIWTIFENTDVSFSLVVGGIAATVLAGLLYMLQMKNNNTASFSLMGRAIVSGVKVMMSPVLILIFAWALAYHIEKLETGLYLSDLVMKANLPISFLPVIMFILAGVMAFSTGTSWGSFGILLPIAGTIMIKAAPEMLLPALAAVLAGAVFGDHCSPISDTTILSATGAGCNLIDHVTTQLPYALISAGIATSGYIVLGITGSVWLGLAAVFVILITLFSIWALSIKKSTTGKSATQL
ncbi:Na+/H+ antiporter NhaC family protein [Sporosarcina sp. HYO08]|uniref:Na+/H+ antiporter NhaC family protein n=1 Tax=Sporosarcina sp. HYO08 TaxID=1759557 RepID=UPI00079162C7|nr:Na+/H+ antiporter NhaC family protein [Sporosarcina sp. HYO08]KXH79236.1 sodium:proton antiporter [Sporosarcina sp. HYO08]